MHSQAEAERYMSIYLEFLYYAFLNGILTDSQNTLISCPSLCSPTLSICLLDPPIHRNTHIFVPIFKHYLIRVSCGLPSRAC